MGRAQVVAVEEVERFRSTYCLFMQACKILGISRATLARWETEGRIQPVYVRQQNMGLEMQNSAAGLKLSAERFLRTSGKIF